MICITMRSQHNGMAPVVPRNYLNQWWPSSLIQICIAPSLCDIHVTTLGLICFDMLRIQQLLCKLWNRMIYYTLPLPYLMNWPSDISTLYEILHCSQTYIYEITLSHILPRGYMWCIIWEMTYEKRGWNGQAFWDTCECFHTNRALNFKLVLLVMDVQK